MDINVTIKCPDLTIAAAALAKAIMGAKETAETPTPAMPQAAAVSAPSPAQAPSPASGAAAPATVYPSEVNPAANPTAAPGPAIPTSSPAIPTSSPATATPAPAMTAPTVPTAVPTSPAPQITGDMVAKAGADLIAANPAAMAQLNGLLQKYGVGCAQELRPDQIGPFATEMRALGAKI